jgi:hypothetical protein
MQIDLFPGNPANGYSDRVSAGFHVAGLFPGYGIGMAYEVFRHKRTRRRLASLSGLGTISPINCLLTKCFAHKAPQFSVFRNRSCSLTLHGGGAGPVPTR